MKRVKFESPLLRYDHDELFEKHHCFDEPIPLYQHVSLSEITRLECPGTGEKKSASLLRYESNEAVKMQALRDGLSDRVKDFEHSSWVKLSEVVTNGQIFKHVLGIKGSVMTYREFEELRQVNKPLSLYSLVELDKLNTIS